MDDHSRAAGCRQSPGAGCPYVDRNDARCGHRFTLGRIDQAFTVCFGAFQGCPIYQRMIAERDATGASLRVAAGAAASAVAAVSASAASVNANINVIPLRATGT